eukprot:3934957-Rhodomonas_salina.1
MWAHAMASGQTVLPAGMQLGPNSRALGDVDVEGGDTAWSSELVRAGLPAVSFVDSGLLPPSLPPPAPDLPTGAGGGREGTASPAGAEAHLDA